MALKQAKPRNFSPEQFQSVSQASAQQTGNMVTPKTIDPNFPVFEIPVNKKVLCYVPNFTQDLGNGAEMLMDKGAFHQVIVGNSFHTKRCYSGINAEEMGYDGTCPFCDSMSECWELFNEDWKQTCLQKGVAIDDPTDPLKETRKDLLKKMAVTKADIFLTFPLVIFECEEGKTAPKVVDGAFVAHVEWYTIRETTYKEKWVKSFETIETDDDSVVTHPAGRWFVLDYTYESKSGQYTKMDSARALKVSHKTMKNYAEQTPEFDKFAEAWTPAQATQTVIANFYLDMADAKEFANEAMKSTRDRLTMLKGVTVAQAQIGAGVGTGAVGASPEAIASSFGAEPIKTGEVGNTGVGTSPQVELGTAPQ